MHDIETELPINEVVSSVKDTVIAEQENIESNQQDNIVEKFEDDSNLSTGIVENFDKNVEKHSNEKYKQSFTVENYKGMVIKEENTVEIDDDEKIILNQTKKEEGFPQNKLIMVNFYRSNGKMEEIELEDYAVGVVAGEMSTSFNKEALKAEAIVARTYALRKINLGEKITDNV